LNPFDKRFRYLPGKWKQKKMTRQEKQHASILA